MHLYNLTLHKATVINQAIIGRFTGAKRQEVLAAHNDYLELWRPDPETSKLHQVCVQAMFGRIRTICPFRLTGGSRDHVIVGTDAGTITVLEYSETKRRFITAQQQTFGRSGLRRFIPGQYIASDPRGRSAMIGGIERQKFVYIFNRDNETNLIMTSPLEAHKGHTFCFDIVGVDVGYENPVFAALEMSYAGVDADRTGEAVKEAGKMLVYYELDLGLNNVVRKWSDPVDSTANKLISLPGGGDGPSGVLVCAEGKITYKHNGEGAREHTVAIPRRVNPLEDRGRGVMIAAAAVHRMKSAFFILLQGDTGDLYKVTVEYEGEIVIEVKIKYFDTIPTATSLCILRSGFLFAASEAGNHGFYQFQDLGDDTETPEYSSTDYDPESEDMVFTYFQPHELSSLAMVDEVEATSPLIEAKVLNLAEEETPQIYALCGRGAGSALKILRHGLEMSELAVSELPGNPRAVWTVKKGSEEQFDTYIVVSFLDATLVLSVGEEVEEATNTEFQIDVPTLCVHELGKDSMLQVTAGALRHIRHDGRVSEWKTPRNREIVAAAANESQVLIALNRGELVYFELDLASNTLREWGERVRMGAEVTALAVMQRPEGRVRAPFAAVASQDQTVRVLSLNPESCMQQQSMQAVVDMPESLALVELGGGATSQDQSDGETPRTPASPYLFIGLQNGLFQRSVVDPVTGGLSDTRTRFLGTRPVRLFEVRVQDNQRAVMALSSRPWLNHIYRSQNRLIPLSYDALDFASSFASAQSMEGIVAIAENTLRILTIDHINMSLNQAAIPLKYTPRRMALNEESKHFVIIEADHATYGEKSLREKLIESVEEVTEEDVDQCILPPEQFGHTRAPKGQWASCIRVLNPFTGETSQLIELEDNEAAFSLLTAQLVTSTPTQNGGTNGNSGDTGQAPPEATEAPSSGEVAEHFVVIGTARNVTLTPRSQSEAYLKVYRWVNDGTQLELVHATPVEEIPQAVLEYGGKLMVALGRTIRLYQMGKKKLLRKAQTVVGLNLITSLQASGNRVIITDVKESVHFALYQASSQRIHIFADDPVPRHPTASILLDHDTVAMGDKFGNLAVLRLPQKVSKEVEADLSGNLVVHTKGRNNGAPFKLADVVNYHVGEIITSIHRAVLVAGGREVLLYTTLQGSIQVAIPFVSKEDLEFMQTLEMHIRSEDPPLCGRDHATYRSSFAPVKSCIDGDLCEQYLLLSRDKQEQIALELDRSVVEVAKKLEDMRTMFAF